MLQAYNWDEDHKSVLFDAKLKHKNSLQMKHAAQLQNAGGERDAIDIENDERLTHERHYKTWKDDSGERARRMWLWWQSKIVALGTRKFPCFCKAVSIVALIRPSSAQVERVFSHLKRLVDLLGYSCLEETVQTRLQRAFNKF